MPSLDWVRFCSVAKSSKPSNFKFNIEFEFLADYIVFLLNTFKSCTLVLTIIKLSSSEKFANVKLCKSGIKPTGCSIFTF